MADRFFPNDITDYIDEAAASSPAADLSSSSSSSSFFLRAALELKQKVRSSARAVIILASSAASGCARDVGGRRSSSNRRGTSRSTVYTGALGTALLLFRAFLVTGDRADLATCAEIVSACDASSAGEEFVTFICGRAGVCALGAVVAKHTGDEAALARYLGSFKQCGTVILTLRASCS